MRSSASSAVCFKNVNGYTTVLSVNFSKKKSNRTAQFSPTSPLTAFTVFRQCCSISMSSRTTLISLSNLKKRRKVRARVIAVCLAVVSAQREATLAEGSNTSAINPQLALLRVSVLQLPRIAAPRNRSLSSAFIAILTNCAASRSSG